MWNVVFMGEDLWMYLISSVLKWDQIGVKTGYFELEEKKLSKRHPTAPNVYSDVSCWQPYKVNSVETYCDTISSEVLDWNWIGIVLLRALRLILKIFLVRSILKNIQLKPWNHKLEHKNNSMIFGFVGKSSINISKHCLYIHAVNSLNCNKK